MPIKVQGQGLSTMATLKDPIKLSIYLDPLTQSATGSLYIDDGETFAYRTMGQQALLNFTYCNHTLHSRLINRPARNSTFLDGFFISQVEVFGTQQAYKSAVVLNTSNQTLITTGSDQRATISGLSLNLRDHLYVSSNEPITILSLHI